MKLTELKPGDHVIADGGFTCIEEGARLEVKSDPEVGVALGPEHQLYVDCAVGQHFLDGQLTDDGELVGLSRAPEPVAR